MVPNSLLRRYKEAEQIPRHDRGVESVSEVQDPITPAEAPHQSKQESLAGEYSQDWSCERHQSADHWIELVTST